MSNKFVKKMDDFFKIISEAFENPLPIKWIDKYDLLLGIFIVNNNIYQIKCEDKKNHIWKYDFYILEENKKFSPELTGLESDKFRVLPTVKSGMEYLILNKEVNAIVFGATDKSRGRKKLYESFCVEFSEKNNFEFYTKIYSDEGNSDKQIFIMYRKNIDMDNLSKIIFKIIEEEKY